MRTSASPSMTTTRDQAGVRPDILSQALEACVNEKGSIYFYIVAYQELSR